MNLIKRIFFAWRALWRSRLLMWVFVLMALFYIWAAMDLFWIGTEAWQSAAMSVLFMLPMFVYVATIVLVYVYAFMKIKISQQQAELDKATIATTAPCKDAESVSASSANNADAISSSVPASTDDDGDPEA